MSTPNDCPDAALLKHFLDTGTVADTGLPWTRDSLEHHLDECAGCQHSLERLVAGQESWEGVAKLLAGIGNDSGQLTHETPALRDLMNENKDQLPDAFRGEARTDDVNLAAVSLDFLQPSDQPDSRGRLGSYEVLEVVGRGGMGIVLKAYDPTLRRIVAIKVMASHLAASPIARKRFIREARAAAAVSHDHVVAIYAVEELQEPPFLVMQFISGKTLRERLAADGPLSVSEVLRIGMQTAAGLAAAHAQGLVHRDIKPANILLENGVERVKITDFGLARAVDDVGMTQTGIVAGTPQFMAPEQANGEAIDVRSDLFSLGTVMYMLCTGRPPFRATTTMGLLKRICEETPRPIRELNADIPDWLDEIIAKLLAKRPADRFQSAKEVSELLSQWLAYLHEPLSTPRPIPISASSILGNVSSPAESRQTMLPMGGKYSLLKGIWGRLKFPPVENLFPPPLGRLYWISMAIWGLAWFFLVIDSNQSVPIAIHRMAIAAVLFGWTWPLGILFVAGIQRWRAGTWDTSVAGSPPWRFLLQPVAGLFLGLSLYWGWQQATCGTIILDIDDPKFSVSFMGPSLTSNQSFSADFYPLRVRAGNYQWGVRHGSDQIGYGKLEVAPRQTHVIKFHSPYPIGQADSVCLPGRWEYQGSYGGTPNSMTQPEAASATLPDYIDISNDRIAVHSSKLNHILKALTGLSPEVNSVDNAPRSATYTFKIPQSPPKSRREKIAILYDDVKYSLSAFQVEGTFTADRQRLSLQLAALPDHMPIQFYFTRASDLVCLQGTWTTKQQAVVLNGMDSTSPPADQSPAHQRFPAPKRLRFSGNAFEDRDPDPTPDETDAGTIMLYPAKNPKQITLYRTCQNGVIQVRAGIYRIDGDQLTLCLGEDDRVPLGFDVDSRSSMKPDLLMFQRAQE